MTINLNALKKRSLFTLTSSLLILILTSANSTQVEALSAKEDILDKVSTSINSFKAGGSGKIYYKSQSSGTGLSALHTQVLEFNSKSVKSRGSISNFESYQELGFAEVEGRNFITKNTLFGLLSKSDTTLGTSLEISEGKELKDVNWIEISPEASTLSAITAGNFIKYQLSNGTLSDLKANFYLPERKALTGAQKIDSERFLLKSKDRSYLYTIKPDSITLSINAKGYSYFFKFERGEVVITPPIANARLS